MHESDPKAFELLAGHDVKMSMAHYQIFSNKRKEKATEKFLEIMTTKPGEEKTSTHFGTRKQFATINRL